MNSAPGRYPSPMKRPWPKLAAAIGAPGLLARILVARGLESPEKAMAFLTQDAPLSDPFALKDMDKAVARILKAVDAGEAIVIFGDYDVDGVTATALLFEHLRGMGASVRCKLPSRDEEGYGLTVPIVESLAEKNTRSSDHHRGQRRFRRAGGQARRRAGGGRGGHRPPSARRGAARGGGGGGPRPRRRRKPLQVPFRRGGWPSSCAPRWTAAPPRNCWSSAGTWRPSAPWRT